MSHSSSGLGHRVFIPATGVQFPYGMLFLGGSMLQVQIDPFQRQNDGYEIREKQNISVSVVYIPEDPADKIIEKLKRFNILKSGEKDEINRFS